MRKLILPRLSAVAIFLSITLLVGITAIIGNGSDSLSKNAMDIDLTGLPVIGSTDAKVTIVTFFDYKCPNCQRFEEELQQVLQKYPKDVRLVFKNFPASLDEAAMEPAIAALAANDQGKFKEFHFRLLANCEALDSAVIRQIAKDLELDLDRFNEKMRDPVLKELVKRDFSEGLTKLDIRSIPTVFVNGRRLKGHRLKAVEDAIDAALKSGENPLATPPSGGSVSDKSLK